MTVDADGGLIGVRIFQSVRKLLRGVSGFHSMTCEGELGVRLFTHPFNHSFALSPGDAPVGGHNFYVNWHKAHRHPTKEKKYTRTKTRQGVLHSILNSFIWTLVISATHVPVVAIGVEEMDQTIQPTPIVSPLHSDGRGTLENQFTLRSHVFEGPPTQK